MDLAQIESLIATTGFFGAVQHFPVVGSTNDLALQAAHGGASRGVWIADEQTAGRGRGNHTWHSPAGGPTWPAGLYMTAFCTPAVPMQSAPRLSFAVAIAVQSAIASTFGFRAPAEIDIRWPNDLLLNRRKVGGILIETAAHAIPDAGPAMLRYAVVGIGINCNQLEFPPDLDPIATSLRRELPGTTQPLRREPLAAAILVALDAQLRALTANPGERTSDNPSAHSTWIAGKRVRVEPRPDQPGSYTGTTAGLNPDGFLLVEGDDGQLHTVLSGGLREPESI
jgi:BirA family biotin operon repressor/biotin-[acetyl-CoA-carboxylase] ligase